MPFKPYTIIQKISLYVYTFDRSKTKHKFTLDIHSVTCWL